MKPTKEKTTLKWFNHNTWPELSTPTYQQAHMGKSYKVTYGSGNSFRSKYCQIAAGTFRFIAKDGNRVVDDNTRITKAVLWRKS